MVLPPLSFPQITSEVKHVGDRVTVSNLSGVTSGTHAGVRGNLEGLGLWESCGPTGQNQSGLALGKPSALNEDRCGISFLPAEPPDESNSCGSCGAQTDQWQVSAGRRRRSDWIKSQQIQAGDTMQHSQNRSRV